MLQPTSRMTIVATNAAINVYKPVNGEPSSGFTIEAFAPKGTAIPPAPTIRRAGNGILIEAHDPLDQLLVRVPDRVDLTVDSKTGSVNVTDVTGNVDVSATKGDVHVMVPGYAQASTVDGHVSVTFGATQWPGTLKFSSGNGDVEVYIAETAKFHVRMHTDDGTLFTDFGLKGSARGTSETIEGNINGGSSQNVDIESKRGTVRLLRLAPQA